MRRGCTAVGEIRCDECHQLIEYAQRYLVTDEEDEDKRFCTECSLKKGYATYKEEKGGQKTLTFSVKQRSFGNLPQG